MKPRLLLGLIFVVLAWCACSSPRTDDEAAASGRRRAAKKAEKKAAALAAEEFKIKELRFSPAAPFSSNRLTVEPVLAAPVEEVEYQVRWFINDKEIELSTGLALEPSLYKKKDWIYCLVQADSGQRLSPWVRSGMIQILNAPPVIVQTSVPPFSIPGTFTHRLLAEDPDKDPLTFALVSPQDAGIQLHKDTGELSWNLDNERVAKLQGKAEIRFAAVDSDGERTEGSLVIQFQQKK